MDFTDSMKSDITCKIHELTEHCGSLLKQRWEERSAHSKGCHKTAATNRSSHAAPDLSTNRQQGVRLHDGQPTRQIRGEGEDLMAGSTRSQSAVRVKSLGSLGH